MATWWQARSRWFRTPGSAGRGWQHHQLAAIDFHGVTGSQLPPPTGLDRPVDAHLAALDAVLGLTAGAHQTLPFEKLLQLHGADAPEQR
jgi:hypothetical protein